MRMEFELNKCYIKLKIIPDHDFVLLLYLGGLLEFTDLWLVAFQTNDP